MPNSTKKVNAKSAAKSAKTQPAAKSILTREQRSLIAKFAALKAHCHKTFQSDRTREEQKEQRSAYASALKTAPAFIKARFSAL